MKYPAILAIVLACPRLASAVDFGVMETAVPIRDGYFKLISYPISVTAGALREQDVGVVLGIGYGISEHWDTELQVSTYDDITFLGGDVEYTFLDRPQLDMSVITGAHYANLDFGTQEGADLTYVVSYAMHPPEPPAHYRFPATREGSGLTLYGALDLAYDEIDLARPGSRSVDASYTSVHLVPGLQYRLGHAVDIVAEIGIGMNGDTDDYFALGTSYYFFESRPVR